MAHAPTGRGACRSFRLKNPSTRNRSATMKRFNSAIAAALVCAAFGAGAFAQDKPAPSRKATDKTQVQPSKQEAQQTEPSNENMDANAQRAHDRNTGTTAKSK